MKPLASRLADAAIERQLIFSLLTPMIIDIDGC